MTPSPPTKHLLVRKGAGVYSLAAGEQRKGWAIREFVTWVVVEDKSGAHYHVLPEELL